MNESGPRRIPPDQSSGSGHTIGISRHPYLTDLIPSKRVCFYKSGDPQFNGLSMVINNRTFKTFDALLDSLSKKVPLPFGVRNITTPRGVHAVRTLEELEDGKSYICSDKRKVKPINLTLASKKLPPWYHARPASARRQAVQLARFSPGRATHKREPVAVRTPKKLLVFRNGDPSVRHTVLLQKRTTPTFESLLAFLSELMQFHVVKLHTPDGRRVDGLPALILCSGTVVAAGREPFRSANYNVQKAPAPTWQPTKPMGPRRLKAVNRKQKSISSISKARNFSPSSERYIVNRIQSSIADSLCDLPSNPTDSVELETGRILESVAETEDGEMPEDDIEKSFRVNQDGSMTVEMRVRLTIKEEETVHWTTTLSRSSVANQRNTTCFPEPEPLSEQESVSPLDSQNPTASADRNESKDDDDNDPPSLDKGIAGESGNEEENDKVQMDAASPRRAPTPGPRRIRTKQTSMESVKSVTAEEIQEGMVGSYSYREETENGAVTEQYCMVKQSSSRPVPKPRGLGSMDANSRNLSTVKSAEMAEILQIEAGGEEVTETVLHIYEQQTCQDNFHADSHFCAQGLSMSGILYGRPATSGTACFSSNNDFETELGRPSTASESISIWRAESMSLTDFTLPSLKTGADYTSPQVINVQKQHIPKPTKGKESFQVLSEKPQQRVVNTPKRIYSKPKVIKKRVHRIMSPGKRQKENIAEAPENHKKVKPFSSAGFIKRIYGYKPKPAKSVIKLKKKPTQNSDGGVTTKSSELSDDAIKCAIKDPNISSPAKENKSETVSFEALLDVPPAEGSQPRGTLTRQESMHQERKSEKETYDVSESMSLPAFNSSSSVTNEYVENWLEKAHLNPTVYPDEESQKVETVTQVGSEGGMSGEEKTEMQTCPTLTTSPSPDTLLATKVKQRIQSFENKLAPSPSLEKTTITQQVAHTHTTITNPANCNSLAQNNTEEINPLSNNTSSETNPPPTETLTEMPSDGEVEKKSTPVKISVQNVPSAESPVEKTELTNTEHCVMDASSVASSSLHRISSVSTPTSDNQPQSISPTADKAISPTDHTLEETTPIQTDIPSTLSEAPLPRNPSVKKARLVSNLSLERKMSLKKASLDKSALCDDASLETTISSAPINTAAEMMLSNSVSSTGTHQPSETPPEQTESNSILDLPSLTSSPSCISASPTSLTSEGRASSASLSSNEAPTPSNIPFKETKAIKTSSHLSTQKEASSPKPLVKKVKLMSNLSEVSSSPPLKSASSHGHSLDKTTSPNPGIKKLSSPSSSPLTERQLLPQKALLQKRLSPYSQSLEVVSPPMRLKSNKKSLSRNLSSDNASDETLKKTPTQRRRHQTPSPSKKSTAKLPDSSLDKTLTCDVLMSDENKMTKTDDEEKSLTEAQIIPQPLQIANQPNIQPVLEKIFYSIKSIRQITQNKRPSCLEKSNSLPDFSSHVASTFGSSSKALLAFLSVMTLKEGITNVNMHELNANNVSCAEALKMIDSLREIASIEDSHNLKTSLSNLQKSTSKQLLQSWKGFQELSECKSRSSTPHYSEQEQPGPVEDCDIEENVIDELMNELDIPEMLKEELAALPVGKRTESDSEGNVAARIIGKGDLSPKENIDANSSHSSKEEAVNVRELAQTDKPHKDKDCEYEQKVLEETCMAQCPPIGHNEEGHLHNVEDKDSSEGMQSCRDEENQGKEKEQQSHNEDKSNQEKAHIAYMDVKVSTKKNLDENRCSSEGEQPDVEGKQLQMNGEESMCVPENELTPNDETCSHEEGQNESIKVALSDPTSQPNAKKRERLPSNNCMRLNIIKEESREEQSSPEEHQPKVGCKELHVIIEESLSGTDREQDSMEEEKDHTDDQQSHEEQVKICTELQARREDRENTAEEEKVSLEDEEHHANKSQNTVRGSILIENQDSYIIQDSSSLVKQSNNLEKHYGFDLDEDSGNDHRSCEEPADEVEQPKAEDEQNSSSEDEFSYEEKESSSEGEHAHTDRYIEESYAEYQETHATGKLSEDVTQCEKAVEKQPSEEIIPQSVAERVSLLEKQVADAHQSKTVTGSSRIKQCSKKDVSDVEDSTSESHTSQPGLCTKSAPQSSLSFSYDSSAVITKEPEGNRVKSIKEMFLAKSVADIQYGQKSFLSPNTSELSDYRPETSDSGGYQSQTSSELSSGEDDSSRKSITKGFVKRTIERLYGKKDANADEPASERPPSAPKEKKKEGSGIFSPFHIGRSKVMSDLSYFNSTSTLDTLSEATRCIAFNAQVGPGDSVPVDQGRWLLKEDTLIRKSASDPVGINKSCENSPQDEEMCEDTKENAPYSLFSTKSDLEDKGKSVSTKCTYFSLPHASDSDVCQDDLSIASKSSVNGDSAAERKEDSEETKTWAERNGMLPAVGTADFKMPDNKVHPLIEGAPAEVVVVQPGKSHGIVNRRLPEPDVLDILYTFCGQHCPIL